MSKRHLTSRKKPFCAYFLYILIRQELELVQFAFCMQRKQGGIKAFFLLRLCDDFYTHSQRVKEIDLHGFQRCHFLDL
jgi:hypothetical protein